MAAAPRVAAMRRAGSVLARRCAQPAQVLWAQSLRGPPDQASPGWQSPPSGSRAVPPPGLMTAGPRPAPMTGQYGSAPGRDGASVIPTTPPRGHVVGGEM